MKKEDISLQKFPLTRMSLLACLCLSTLIFIILAYIFHSSFFLLDFAVTDFFFSIRTSFGVHFFTFITTLASPAVGILIMGMILGIWAQQKHWLRILITTSGFLATGSVTAVLKLLFHRSRPDMLFRAVIEDSYSLPSGHATTAAFVFGFIGYLTLLHIHSNKIRALIICLIIIIVALIDLSRVYLGVHYLSDVLAGNAIGFLGLFLTIHTLQTVRLKTERK